MKRRYWVPLLIFLGLLGAFLSQKTAFAATYAVNGANTGSPNLATFINDCAPNIYSRTGQRFQWQGNTGDKIEKLRWAIESGWGPYSISYITRIYADGTYPNQGELLITSEVKTETIQTYSTILEFVNFGSLTLTNGAFYWAVLSQDPATCPCGTAPSRNSLGGTASGWGTFGGEWYELKDTGPSYNNVWLEYDTAPGPPVNTLAIPFPANESTTPDFWAFELTFNAPTTFGYPLPSSPALNLQVCYGLDQAAVGDCQNSTSTWPNLTIDGNLYPNLLPGTPLNVFLHKTYQLASSTTYYAKAFMYNIVGTFLAESPGIAFTISGEPYIYNEPGIIIPPTATSTEWVITCDPSSGLFQTSFCYLFQYLFKPHPSVLDKWQNIKTLLENKPPLGYFILTKNVLSGISTSTPAFYLAQASAVNENIFNPLKIGLSFVLYLLFGIWLFKRIAHLEL